MYNIEYVDRDDELSEAVRLIMDKSNKVILYKAPKGSGITAFLGRIKNAFKATPAIQCFSAELSAAHQNPLHFIVKNITYSNNALYHTMQIYTDNQFGELTVPFGEAVLKALPEIGETVANFFCSSKKAAPIYTGYYSDNLKEVFVNVLKFSKDTRTIIFIDNAHFLSAEAVNDLYSVMNIANVQLVISISEQNKYFDDFYYETRPSFTYAECDFPEPDIPYVKLLGAACHKTLSDEYAHTLIKQSNKNVRKILFHISMPEQQEYQLTNFEKILLQVISLYNEPVSVLELSGILDCSMYKNILSKLQLEAGLRRLEEMFLLKSFISFNTRERFYALDYTEQDTDNFADDIILSKAVLIYFKKQQKLPLTTLKYAFDLACKLDEKNLMFHFSERIIMQSLGLGLAINNIYINAYLETPSYAKYVTAALAFFCKLKYTDALSILEKCTYPVSHIYNRNVEILYALTLNRCRYHQTAEVKLKSLIKTSKSLDEEAVLVTFLLSNQLHRNNHTAAKETFRRNWRKLSKSSKYPYFLRNAATIYTGFRKNLLHSAAMILFRQEEDPFGYATTMINTASYYLRRDELPKVLPRIQDAYDILKSFGNSHLNLGANNLGACYLKLCEYEKAQKYLLLSCELSSGIMPKTYARINLSALYLKRNEIAMAVDEISKSKELVMVSNVQILKVKFLLQYAFVLFAAGDRAQALHYCQLTLTQSRSTRFRQLHLKAQQLCEVILSENTCSQEMIDRFYVPCCLEYWYFSTLDILANKPLTS